MHVSSRDDPNQLTHPPQRESDVQLASVISFAECMKSRLRMAVLFVFENQQGSIEKYLLRFCRRDSVMRVLSGVTLIPIEAHHP